MMNHISTRNLLAWVGALLALFLAGTYYIEAGNRTTDYPPSSDFYKFYLSAERLAQGKSIYWIIPPKIQPGDPCHPDSLRHTDRRFASASGDMSLGGKLPCLAPNLNPPIFMALVAPVARLPYAEAWWVWAGMSTAFALCCMWLIAGTLASNRAEQILYTLWSSVALLAYYPTFVNFTLGQVGTLVMLPLTLAWLAMRKGFAIKAGIWLGVATSMKPFLGLFLLVMLLDKQWRASMSFVMTVLFFAVIGLLWLGPNTYSQYAQVAGHVTWTTSNWNGSLVGFFDRAFSGTARSSLPEIRAISKLLATIATVCVLTQLLRLLRQARTSQARLSADILFMLTIPASILISPLGWLYYLPWLAISAAIAWQLSAKLPEGRAMRLAFIASLSATVVPVAMKAVPTAKNPTIWYGIDSMYGYALLTAFLVVCVIAKAHIRRPPT